MNLIDYKKKYKLKNVQLAKLFGVSCPTISHWLAGYCVPSIQHAYMIFIKTKGEVTPDKLGVKCMSFS